MVALVGNSWRVGFSFIDSRWLFGKGVVAFPKRRARTCCKIVGRGFSEGSRAYLL